MKSNKTTLWVIGTIILLTALVAGSVYYFRSNNSEVVTNDSQSQVLSEEDNIPDFVQEEEITLSPGETGQFQTLSVKFDKVTQDNRCPTSVQCITAGKVTAQFTLTDGDTKRAVLISSDDPEPYSFTNYFVEMKEVRPAKVNPGTTDPNSYEIVLLVSRNAKL